MMIYLRTVMMVLGPNHSPMARPKDSPMLADSKK